MPAECLKHNKAALKILHYLTDENFLGRDNANGTFLKHAHIVTNVPEYRYAQKRMAKMF